MKSRFQSIRHIVAFPALIILTSSNGRADNGSPESPYDLVIYGATSAGIAAGIEAARSDRSALVIGTRQRIGGLTTNGLGQTDIGSKAGVGGVAREFYERIAEYYTDEDNWDWENRSDYQSEGQSRTNPGETAMWTFEPSAALAVFESMIAEAGLDVLRDQHLDRDPDTIEIVDQRIRSIRLLSGRRIHGRMFIDASYVGDLMAAAKVDYTLGRESNQTYGERYNGVQTRNAVHHQFAKGVSPFIDPKTPSLGLLPGIDPNGPGNEAEADHRIQAYCYRMCLTDHPENRIPFEKPENYNELEYEPLFRNLKALGDKAFPPIHSARMPNRKTDTNNNGGFSTDYIGQNYDYPEASYERRREIERAHLRYQQGLMWTLANHPRVPDAIRNEMSRWGLSKDEFEAFSGWPELIYIREARRMVSDYVMTEADCFRDRIADDPVGLGAYNMDSHNTQRHVDELGQLRNEGDVQVSPGGAYRISYRSIIPKKGSIENLLVPVCVSASHISFGSIRMEPVFMILGQSAASAADLALDKNIAVQDLPYEALRARLMERGQRLDIPKAERPRIIIPTSDLEGVVVDASDLDLPAYWRKGDVTRPFVGRDYAHNGAVPDLPPLTLHATLPHSGTWELRVAYCAHPNRSQNVTIRIRQNDQSWDRIIDQTTPAPIDDLFESLGAFEFSADSPVDVEIMTKETSGYVIVDAIQFLPARDE